MPYTVKSQPNSPNQAPTYSVDGGPGVGSFDVELRDGRAVCMADHSDACAHAQAVREHVEKAPPKPRRRK